MTEKEAYQLALDLWIWFYKNPGKYKDESPYWHKIKNMDSACPLCELNIKRKRFKCCGDIGNNGKELCPWSCFYKAYERWALSNFDYFAAAAYIASKIRRHMRKKGWIE